jgi:hypothetical protein
MLVLLTGGVVAIAVCRNVWPRSLGVPDGVLPVLFGICLAASVWVEYRCLRSLRPESRDVIRRSSRLVYLWLYCLFGADELATWLNHLPLGAGADKLLSYLAAGVIVLILIRIAVRPRSPQA